MPSIDDYDLGKNLMICCVGDPGCGKSVAFGSFPDPIYIFDTDGRIAPVVNYWAGKKQIEYDTYTVQDYEKFDATIEGLKKGTKKYKTKDGKLVPFATVVVDGLTSTAWSLIEYAIGLSGRTGSVAYSGKGIIATAEVQDYGLEIQGLNNLISDLRHINAHRILTAHVITKVVRRIDGTEEVFKTLLTAGTKIASALPAYFNEVWRIEAKPSLTGGGSKRILHFSGGGYGVEHAKTALPLPPNIPVPANGDIFTEISKLLKEKGITINGSV